MSAPEEVKIDFVGLVVRTSDGQTIAADLSGEHLKLNVAVEVPHEHLDVTPFGAETMWQGAPDRVNISISGRRLPDASQLFATRVISADEPPFAAFGDSS